MGRVEHPDVMAHEKDVLRKQVDLIEDHWERHEASMALISLGDFADAMVDAVHELRAELEVAKNECSRLKAEARMRSS